MLVRSGAKTTGPAIRALELSISTKLALTITSCVLVFKASLAEFIEANVRENAVPATFDFIVFVFISSSVSQASTLPVG